jgi:catechol 2,3-dioxygenase-like lactoylglutathione lyase family enzyme
MMRGLLFFVSGAVVALLIQTAIAQNHNPGVIQLNHVGIAVDDMDESLAFYTETMGFEEAFRVTNDEGRVGLAYLRVSETTYVELQPANENRPAGLNHFGIQVEGMEAVKAMYEGRGASPGETRRGSTQAILSNILDPQGVRIELSEYPSDSLQGKALAGE